MSLKLAGIMGIVLAVIIGIGYWYYTDSQATIQHLTEERAQLEINVATSKKAMESLNDSVATLNTQIKIINTEFDDIRTENQQLRERLSKHDLGLLGQSKPGLVSKVVTSASRKAGRCFELISGAPLTEEEKNAKTGKQFNSECPSLFDDLVNP